MNCVAFLKRMSFVTGFMLLYFLSLNAGLFAQQDDKQGLKAAIFVENRAGRSFDNKVAVFEDFITGRVAEKGFSVISREVVTDSLKTYSPGTTKENKLDTLLGNNGCIPDFLKKHNQGQIVTQASSLS